MYSNHHLFKLNNMKLINKIKQYPLLLVTGILLLAGCNKLELDPAANTQPAQGATPTLATLLDDPNFSAFKAAAVKGGLYASLKVPTLRFTVFAPDDAAITASLPPGVPPLAYIASLDSLTARALVSYHIVPQVIASSSITTAFPNFQYPTLLNPAPTVSALLRLTTFPSKRTGVGAWVNNIPLVATDVTAVNGVLHKVARVVAPPSTDLWSKINTDTELTYLKAAIARADSGVAPGGRIQDALNTAVNPAAIGSNLTVFAPTDAAMKLFLTGAITKALVDQGLPLATAQFAATTLVTNFGSLIISNPSGIPDVPGFPPGLGNQLAAVLTPTLAKGIVVYHILSSQSGTYAPPGIRVFSVNMPTTGTAVKTLLNSAIAAHPGLVLQATFTGPVVTAATVKGAANATASNIIISAPPTFTHDLHYVNGIIHKIDQVLLPQ